MSEPLTSSPGPGDEPAGQTSSGEAVSDVGEREAAGTSARESAPGAAADTAGADQKPRGQADKAAEYWDRLLRTTADFENFKKRVAKDRAEAAKYAQVPLVQSLLPLLDNLEMALAATDQANHQSLESLKTGVSMIVQQFRSTLAEAGLAEVDAQGQPFDPNLHEAVMQQETTDLPEGHVVQQLRRGYKLHDRLLRPATVIVAKAPATPSAPSDASSGCPGKA